MTKMLMLRKTFLIYMILFSLQTGPSHSSCGRAEYHTGGQCCSMCAPGSRVYKQCTDYTSTSCVPCTNGYYLHVPNGLTQCFMCTHCDSELGLRVKRPCTAISNTICGPMEGYYCTETKKGCTVAQKHRGCQPGQYTSQKGTEFADTVCIKCTGETFSDGTFTLCKTHRKCNLTEQILNPGTLSSDTECGPHESNSMTAVVVVVVLFILVITAAVPLTLYYFKKRKKERNSGKQKCPQESTGLVAIRSTKDMVTPTQEENDGIPPGKSRAVHEKEPLKSEDGYKVP